MTARMLLLLSLYCVFTGCTANNDTAHSQPTTKPSASSATDQPAPPTDTPAPNAAVDNTSSAGEMLADRSSFVGYGAEQYRLLSDRDEIVSVLKNGMVVIVKRVPTPVVAVRCVALTGGIYEKQWLGGGLSHLLEHLVAGGSSERRKESENRDLLQKIGNNSNAYTTEDNTSFFINTTPPHMEEAVDLVSGWMLGAKITVEEYKREYQVVQRELEMGKGEPERAFYYLFALNRYRVNPARVPVIGFQEVIQKLTRDDVYNYYKMAYQPNNMVFSVAGNLDPEKMLSAVKKNVAGAPPGRVFSHNIEPEPAVLTPRTLVCTFPKLGQAHLMLGFPSVSFNADDMYALDLMATALGGGESSIFVEELRDKQQLVSSVSVSDDTPGYTTGTFMIDMQLDPEKVPQATAAAMKLLDQVREKGIDADHLSRAKTQMKSARVRRMQTAEEIAASVADDYRLTGDIHFSDLYVERVDKISAKQVQSAAKKYFDANRLLTTAMFPAEWTGAVGLPKAEDILRPHSATSQPASVGPIAAGISRTVLENGTVLLVKRVATSPTVVMSMYSLGGVTEEDAASNGLGNLTMQMLTRGTQTRSASDIAQFFDSTGGAMDGACGNNSWHWDASCMKDQFEKTMEVYADVVQNPSFADGELALMKKRIAAAIKGADADWTQQSIRFFKKSFYGPLNSPYQFLSEGTEQNVGTFTADQVRNWYQTHVLKRRRVLAIFGDVDMAKAQALAGQLLGKLPAIDADHKPHVPDSFTVRDALPAGWISVQDVKVQKTEQDGIAGVVIGFKADTVIDAPDWYDFAMAKTLTGGYTYPTGYLFETLRGQGLVYVVESQNSAGLSRKLPGTFLVFAGCAPDKVNEVVDQCLLNIARLQGTDADMNPTWFGRAKELIAVADAMEHETPSAQAATAALDELYGHGYDWHATFADKIREVQLAAVRNLAQTRLRDCIVTISTPAPERVTTKVGVRRYESFPPVDLTPRGIQHDTGAAGK